jgi:probable F420-dependent oxidoreductase
MAEWRERARRAEGHGYSALYLTDHFDAQFGPLVASTVAAEATTTLHVGTLVMNNDLRNPVVLAKEISTLGLAAEGRIELGLGAGWLRSDYEESGIAYDLPRLRVDRLAESLALMKALWNEEQVTFEGAHYTVRAARCEPRPTKPPRLIVGGGSKRVLTLAAKEADVVNTYIAPGEQHGDVISRATFDHFDQCLTWVREAAGDRFPLLELQIAPFSVMVVGSRRAAARTATMLGFAGEESLALPILLLGTVDEICEQLLERRQRWGYTNVVVPVDALDDFAPVVARLAGT